MILTPVTKKFIGTSGLLLLLAACDESSDQQKDDEQVTLNQVQRTDPTFSNLPEPPPPPSPPEPEPAVEVEAVADPGQVVISPGKLDFGSIYRREDEIGNNITRKFAVIHQGETEVKLLLQQSTRRDFLRVRGCENFIFSHIDPNSRSCNITVELDVNQAPSGVLKEKILLSFDNGQTKAVPVQGRLSITEKPPAILPPPPVYTPPPQVSARDLVNQQIMSDDGEDWSVSVVEVAYRPDPPDRFIMEDKNYEEKLNETAIESTFPVDKTRMIDKRKHITAILETPINSQLEGRFVAVINRNIYGDSTGRGKRKVLLPAFSTIIGYNAQLANADSTRLPVVITEIQRPDGARISLQASGGDQMGRTGLIGVLDSRLWERFGFSAIVGAINTAAAYATSGTGDTDERLQAAQEQSQETLSDISNKLLEKNIELLPRMEIAGGTRIEIILNDDLYFPEPDRIVQGLPDQFDKKS